MGSPEGAKAASTLYSLIETAKLNDVNPEGYLRFLLGQKIDETNADQLKSLMPWNIDQQAIIMEGYQRPSLKPKDPEHAHEPDLDAIIKPPNPPPK